MNLGELLQIERPLIAFDLEGTSTIPEVSRIVQISIVLFRPSVEPLLWKTFVNPTIPIPREATYGNGGSYPGHGITDEMVRESPTFRSIAQKLKLGFSGVDFAGYNLRLYDLKVLKAEFARVGLDWSYDDAALVDAFRLWQLIEPRSLSDAVRRFLRREPSGMHDAEKDVAETLDVLLAQFDEAALLLPRNVKDLHTLSFPRDPNWIDAEGKFIFIDGVPSVNFTKPHRGKRMRDMDNGFWAWILKTDFSNEMKNLARDAKRGVFPVQAAVVDNVVAEAE